MLASHASSQQEFCATRGIQNKVGVVVEYTYCVLLGLFLLSLGSNTGCVHLTQNLSFVL